MKQIIDIIKKPVDAIDKKFGNSWKKALIYLGIIVGALLVTELIATMYTYVIASKDWSGKLHFEVLKEIKYFEIILDFILEQLIFFGSIFAGIFIYSSISKKEFKLVDVLSLIVIAYVANYLLQAVTNILFMFKFMDVKFLNTVHTILLTTANYYSITIIILGLQKLFGFKFDDKNLLQLAIMFVIMFAIRYILYLAI